VRPHGARHFRSTVTWRSFCDPVAFLLRSQLDWVFDYKATLNSHVSGVGQLYHCKRTVALCNVTRWYPRKRQEGGKLETSTHVCTPQPPPRTAGGALLEPKPTRWLRPFSRRSTGQPRRVRLFATSMAQVPPSLPAIRPNAWQRRGRRRRSRRPDTRPHGLNRGRAPIGQKRGRLVVTAFAVGEGRLCAA